MESARAFADIMQRDQTDQRATQLLRLSFTEIGQKAESRRVGVENGVGATSNIEEVKGKWMKFVFLACMVLRYFGLAPKLEEFRAIRYGHVA